MVRSRLPLLAVVGIAGVLLWLELHQGWFPHDEGALGQAAERVLSGEVPHRDFDEIYTGPLSFLHALAFRVGGVSSAVMRWPLFLVALVWAGALYRIAIRFAPPAGAALVAVVAFVWSVPNYAAPIPSWYNLFCASFGALALLRWLETPQRRWLVLAGVAGGMSFLFKLSGIFYLLGAGLALVAASRPAGTAAAENGRLGAALVSALLLSVPLILAVPLTAAGGAEFARLVLPLGILCGALIGREWRDHVPTAERLRALAATLGPFVIGALMPVAVYGVFLVVVAGLGDTIQGVFVTPFRRVDFAAVHPPGPSNLLYSLLIGLLLVPRREGRGTHLLAAIAAVVFGLVVVGSGNRPGVYGMGWLAAWGLPLLASVGAAGLLLQREVSRHVMGAVMVTAVALGCLLVEFPFAAPIYTIYALPMVMVALAAVVRAGGGTPLPLQGVVAGFLLAFGVFRVMPGTVESLGVGFLKSDEVTTSDLPRSGLRMSAFDAARYEALVGAVQQLAPGRTLWAGPDAPEVYFLSGVPNRTRTMFEFLDASSTAEVPIERRVRDLGATLVVLKLAPSFSPPPGRGTIAALRAEFPNARPLPGFLILWR